MKHERKTKRGFSDTANQTVPPNTGLEKRGAPAAKHGGSHVQLGNSIELATHGYQQAAKAKVSGQIGAGANPSGTELRKVILVVFKSGMIYAANLKNHWHPADAAGADAMRQHILDTVKKLKHIPHETNQ